MKLIILLAICFSFNSSISKTSDKFNSKLERLDSELFERGFNQCDINFLEEIVDEDLIFYHDQSGIQDKSLFLQSMKQNVCADFSRKPIRLLTEGSLKNFPLYDNGRLFGAIQNGEHEFYIHQKGKANRLTSIAKFTSVWKLKDNQWKLSKVLSYDHSSPDLKSVFEETLIKNKVPALGVGIIQNGEIESVNVYGELKKGSPAPKNTLFKVASLTKPIVAFITLKLIEEELLQLDEPLHPYWIDEDIKEDPRHRLLTVKHVLSHQTGFANWRWMDENKKLQFHFNPGEGYQYSGEGFEYLRRAIESKLSTSLEDLAEKYLFIPAQMKSSYFWWTAQVDENRYAVNHDESGQPYKINKYYEANAAANLITTIEDYSKFIIYLLQQFESNPELYNMILDKHVKIKVNNYFGLGWEILSGFPDNEMAVLHTGKDPGVSCLAIYFPNTKNAYIIFMNGDNNQPIYSQVLRHMYLGNELWQKR